MLEEAPIAARSMAYTTARAVETGQDINRIRRAVSEAKLMDSRKHLNPLPLREGIKVFSVAYLSLTICLIVVTIRP